MLLAFTFVPSFCSAGRRDAPVRRGTIAKLFTPRKRELSHPGNLIRVSERVQSGRLRPISAAQAPCPTNLSCHPARVCVCQFETLTEQTKELSALGQKIAGESAEPITRGVNQAFKKAS
jgi:hypothetical protein